MVLIYIIIVHLVARPSNQKPVFMSTLFNFFLHQKSHFLVIFVLKILPLINAPYPFWKISHPGASIIQTIRYENNNLHLQLLNEGFCFCFCLFVCLFVCWGICLFVFVTCKVVWWQQIHNDSIKTCRIIVNIIPAYTTHDFILMLLKKLCLQLSSKPIISGSLKWCNIQHGAVKHFSMSHPNILLSNTDSAAFLQTLFCEKSHDTNQCL